MKNKKRNLAIRVILLACLVIIAAWFYPKLQQARLNQALLDAVKQGNHTRIQALLNAGADPNSREDNYPTALIFAADLNDDETVRLLIARGANVNAKGAYGQYALQYALNSYYYANAEKYPFVIEQLLEHGADPNLVNDAGQTSLERARLDHDFIVHEMPPGWHDEALPLLNRTKVSVEKTSL